MNLVLASHPAPRPGSSRARFASRARARRLRWVIAALALAPAGLFLLGLIRFVAADGVVEYQRPALGASPAGVHNLASFRRGVHVRASSSFRVAEAQHHPAFLVDEVAAPGLIEKWTTLPGDRRPWVEVRWPEPRQLQRVVLRHAGWREDARYTTRRYRLACLTASGRSEELSVTDNHEPVTEHALRCAGARGVRLDLEPNGPDEVVRLYELEAWGQ
jgi:hypothetical protein